MGNPFSGYPMPSDLYPQGPSPDNPPPLTPDTFGKCYQSLQGWFDDSAWNDAVNRWYSYALDGDITQLPVPGFSGPATPWDFLSDVCTPPMQNDLSGLQNDYTAINDAWQGPAATNYLGWLKATSDQLNYFVGTGFDAQTGSWLAQAGALLRSAHAVQVGFKRDLYELGFAACKAGWKHNNGGLFGSDGATTGLLLLGMAGLVLGGAGAVVMAGEISARIFAAGVISMAGNYVFTTVPNNTSICGGVSFNNAIDSLVGQYQSRVNDVTAQMASLTSELNSHAANLPQPPAIRPVDALAPGKSLRFSNFFTT
jgi:uncharacterized protein YukE